MKPTVRPFKMFHEEEQYINKIIHETIDSHVEKFPNSTNILQVSQPAKLSVIILEKLQDKLFYTQSIRESCLDNDQFTFVYERYLKYLIIK